MPLTSAAVAIDNGTVLVLIVLLAVPFSAIAFSRAGEAYRSIGKGAFSIDSDLPLPRYLGRRLRKGLQPLDVEAETERQLADFIGSP